MRRQLAALAAVIALASGCEAESSGEPEASGAPSGTWKIIEMADGLDHPWGIAALPDGGILFTERPGRISLLTGGGAMVELDVDLDDVKAQGEGGLMGVELSPEFETDNTFYTCMATTHGDVQIIPWILSDDQTSAERQPALVSGITLNPSGRHSGCRLRIGGDNMLYAGVGDSAQGANPQDLGTLGGKVLRIDPATGQAPADNPFADSDDEHTRLVYSYGHRNVQGLAVQPGTGSIYAIEHGPSTDDEINLLQPGGNYGWDPAGDGSYDESVPMTDTSIEGAIEAVWSSGSPTIAPSGGIFLTGEQWGEREGLLAFATLKGQALYLIDIGTPQPEAVKVAEFDGTYGRLRSVETDADGNLYLSTDNGDDDVILRVSAK